jgi:hypothetical protein
MERDPQPPETNVDAVDAAAGASAEALQPVDARPSASTGPGVVGAAWPDPSAAGAQEPPAPPAVLPPPAPAPPPATGWAVPGAAVVPGASVPPRPAGPVRTVVIPTIVLLAAVVLAALITLADPAAGSGAYRAGRAAGTVVGVLIGAGIVLLILRRLLGRQRVASYRLIAAAVPFVFVVLGAAALGARMPDPSTAMVIAAPYTLADPGSDTAATLNASAKGQAFAVKLVDDASGTTLGLLMATAGSTHPDDGFWADFDRGIGATPGVTSTPTQYQGQTARRLAGQGVVGLSWVAPDGLLITVYAKDQATVLAIADAETLATSGP